MGSDGKAVGMAWALDPMRPTWEVWGQALASSPNLPSVIAQFSKAPPRCYNFNLRTSLLPATPFCPFAALNQQPMPPGTKLPKNRGVDLGVAIILQSSDTTVLLTRRTRTLRVSPNLWVPPGGHVELDEEVASYSADPTSTLS